LAKVLVVLLAMWPTSGAAEASESTAQAADIGGLRGQILFAGKRNGYATITCNEVAKGGEDLDCAITMVTVSPPNAEQAAELERAIAAASSDSVVGMLRHLCSGTGATVLAKAGVNCEAASPQKRRESLQAYARRVLSRSCHLSQFSQTLRFKRTDATTWTSVAYGSCATAITTISADGSASWELRMMHAPRNQSDELCKSLRASMDEVSVWSTGAGPIAAGCEYIDQRL
jgi:hypothetical protein